MDGATSFAEVTQRRVVRDLLSTAGRSRDDERQGPCASMGSELIRLPIDSIGDGDLDAWVVA
jgi:hypothetical protein